MLPRCCFGFLLVILTLPPISGADDRVALVIGNAKYEGNPLRNPVNDAAAMETSLKNLNFKVTKKTDINLAQMEDAIVQFKRSLKKESIALFFYAGHGLEVKGDNYLMPLDAKFQEEFQVKEKCYKLDQVLTALDDSKAALKIVILDCCRDNPFTRSWRRGDKGNGLAAVANIPDGTIIAFSTAPGKTALDSALGSSLNSPYTKQLVASLNQRPKDGLEVIAALRGASQEVKLHTGQAPWINFDSSIGNYYLVGASGKPMTSPAEPRPIPLNPGTTSLPVLEAEIQLGGDQAIYQGSKLSLGGTLLSIPEGVEANLIADVDFGDGSVIEPVDIAPDLSFQVQYIYAEPGEYAVSILVSDHKTSPAKASAKVTVKKLNPVPAADVGAIARKNVRELYKKEFSDANKPTAKAAWADQLIKFGQDTPDAPTDRYAVLAEAAMQASDAIEPTIAFRAVDEIAKTFEINRHSKRAEVFASIVPKIKAFEVSNYKKCAEAGLIAVDEALNDRNFLAASELLEIARKAAEQGKELALVRKVTTTGERIAARKTEWESYTKGKVKLQTIPNDVESNRAVGHYLCFRMGQWHQGFLHLMKANDPKLSPLATAELNRKRSVAETLSLADGWFSLAKDAEESLARLMRSRSMKWYKAVAPELTGVAQQRVDQLLSTYDTEPSTENRVKLLPIGKWSVKWKFEGATSVQFNKDGTRAVCSSNGPAISILDLDRGVLETKLRIRDFPTETSAYFSPDGKSLGVGIERAGQFDIWDLKTQNKRLTISAHKEGCGFVCISPSGHELLTAGADSTVKIWDAESGQIKHVLNHGGARSGRGLFSLDGKKVYIWGYDLGNILVFDMATGSKIATFNCHDKGISNVSEFQVGNLLLTASTDGTAKLIDKQTGKVRGALEGHQKHVFCAVARPDGRVFATSAQDRTVRIWDAATRKTIQVLNGHTADQVFCVQFSPNGKLLASCSYNETLIWEQQP